MPDRPRTYPTGVPCWVDVTADDLAQATDFYAGLFAWQFRNAMPPDAPDAYLIATLDGEDAAALALGDDARWMSYIACDDADAMAEAVARAGGRVIEPPEDAGPGGRMATCADPQGGVFRLWQPRQRLGAQVANIPGAWNFSDLHAPDPAAAQRFYREVFGWEVDRDLGAGMFRLPGYGDHLASTVDPDIHERQASAPPGFADVVAGFTSSDESARWWIRFTVEDRDAAAASVERLGGRVLSATDTAWTREAVVADPGGAQFIVSQFTPPDEPA
ncbi:VOC family protein [Microbacterium sp. NPDC056569]|uniref:VOC family protein n=1 Tax=Microbacterium sp. NPDC056569 TaxID=3345867 RepID=UPI00366D2254